VKRAFKTVLTILSCLLFGAGQGLAARKAAPLPAEPAALIQIGVEVVEVDEKKAQRLGVDWLNQLHVEEAMVPSFFKVGSLIRSKIFADLQALVEQGAADLLANPKLVTRDGTTATFHAGGELPYAAPGSLGTVTIEFKPYGVNLKINPKLDEAGRIAMTVDAEISGPDEQNTVLLAGNKVPGLRSRRITSQLTLQPGSTLTMAGLIQNQKEWTRKGVPGLMEIPVLGRLFSHKAQTTQRTSIVVFVTPTILEAPTGTIVAQLPLPSLLRGKGQPETVKTAVVPSVVRPMPPVRPIAPLGDAEDPDALPASAEDNLLFGAMEKINGNI
jgi:Flp pilus assembly secretin CpaC